MAQIRSFFSEGKLLRRIQDFRLVGVMAGGGRHRDQGVPCPFQEAPSVDREGKVPPLAPFLDPPMKLLVRSCFKSANPLTFLMVAISIVLCIFLFYICEDGASPRLFSYIFQRPSLPRALKSRIISRTPVRTCKIGCVSHLGYIPTDLAIVP